MGERVTAAVRAGLKGSRFACTFAYAAVRKRYVVFIERDDGWKPTPHFLETPRLANATEAGRWARLELMLRYGKNG